MAFIFQFLNKDVQNNYFCVVTLLFLLTLLELLGYSNDITTTIEIYSQEVFNLGPLFRV